MVGRPGQAAAAALRFHSGHGPSHARLLDAVRGGMGAV